MRESSHNFFNQVKKTYFYLYQNIWYTILHKYCNNISKVLQVYCKNIAFHWQQQSSGGVCEQTYCKNISKILHKYCVSWTTVVAWRSMRGKTLQEYFKNIAKILRFIDNSDQMAEYASYAKNEDNEVIVSAAHDHTQSVFHHRSLSFPLFLSL